jgi:DNA-binding transcriptional regulator YiaG
VTDETKAPEDQEEKNLHAFLDKFQEVYGKLLENIPEKFYSATFLEIIMGGLNTLRHCIENPKDAAVSWASPWVEARYPVGWNWERWHISNYEIPETILEAARKGEDLFKTRTDEVAKMAQDLTAASSSPAILSQLTHHVAVKVKEGQGDEVFFLEPEMEKEWAALKTDEERDAYLDKVREPFSIGALEAVDPNGDRAVIIKLKHPDTEEEDAPPLKPESMPEIIKKLKETPLLYFTLEDEGRLLFGSVVIMIHPLVIDEDKHETYFPVVVGLFFSKDGETSETVNPAEWAGDKDKQEKLFNELWKMLLVDLPRKFMEDEKEEVAVTSSKLVPVGAPSLESRREIESRYLLNRPTIIDKRAAILQAHAGKLNLPRKWKNVRKWEDIVQEEKVRLQEEYGDEAFKNLRKETKDPNARGPLLVKRTNSEGREVVELTRDAEEALMDSVGHKGFRRVIKDKDGATREFLVKRFRVSGGGYMESRLSWYGQAWPLVDEGREKAQKELEGLQDRLRTPLLFDELSAKERDQVESRLRMMESIRDGREVMGAILERFGALGENPLMVPAWNLRTLLECEKDPDGFRRVQGCLRALQEVRFHLKVAGVSGASHEAFGPFLGDVKYIPKGPGEHTDGDFYLTISEAFVGCLKVYQTAHFKIRDPHKVLVYDWGKKLTKEDRKALKSGYVKGFSSLGSYFDRAQGFTEQQSNLRRWIEHNVTLRKTAGSKWLGTVNLKIKKTSRGADEPRLYRREHCPILPEEKLFHGALGNYPKGEHGRKLFGTQTRGTEKSGGHAAGLLQEMGYDLPPGAARAKRGEIVRQALKDMRAVVEEAMGGVVAGRRGDLWLSLHDAERLNIDSLLKDVVWCLFLADDWRERIPEAVERYQKERHAKGEVDYLVKTTPSRDLAEKTETSRGTPDVKVGLEHESLRVRLYVARKDRKLSQAAVGKLFGVSQPIVAEWETGTEPGEDGSVKGRAIPADVAPLLLRWIETGQPPTPRELEVLAKRRRKRPGIKKTG